MTLRSWLLACVRAIGGGIFALICLTDLLAINHNPNRERFTRIDNDTLGDRRLSWQARGLLAYLLSKPADWNVVIQHLLRESPGGRKPLERNLDELERFGYVVRGVRKRDHRGRLGHLEIDVYERPVGSEPPTETDTGHDQGEQKKPQVDASAPYPTLETGPLVTTDRATTDEMQVTTEEFEIGGDNSLSREVTQPPDSSERPQRNPRLESEIAALARRKWADPAYGWTDFYGNQVGGR